MPKLVTAPIGWSYRVLLHCQHVMFLMRPLPNLGDIRYCSPCGSDSSVISIDERELEVYCPECDKAVAHFHILATMSAKTAATVHNVRDKRGHHATVRETGNYITNG